MKVFFFLFVKLIGLVDGSYGRGTVGFVEK